jgi:aminoglycoside phosphotransferase (APT) family kinase protein
MRATATDGFDRIAWERMAADFGPGARVRRVRKLGGGLMSDVFAVELERAPFDRVVVKRVRPDDDVNRDFDVEWECLGFAERIPVPAPRRVALDADGGWFGVPALVMTQLPGRADVTPQNVDDWLRQLALVMATIHATDTEGATGALLRPPEVWEGPTFRAGPLVERSIAAIDEHVPRGGWPPVVIHGDFHPGQTLWQRGRLSGVVDWGDLLLGSRWYEVAYCRADVVFLHGVKAADRILHHYVDITGLEPVDLPAFDLVCGIHAREFGHRFLDAYREQGRTDNMRQCAARLTAFIRRALAELGG